MGGCKQVKIKGIIDECFNDYKKPAMYIAFPTCTFKCDKLNECAICQNSALIKEPDIDLPKEDIIVRYLNNPITQAIIFSGLEPFDSILDLVSFIDCLRRDYKCNDDIVIYTGYTEEELRTGMYDGGAPSTLADFYKFITSFPNIIIKFGRFVMNDQPHYDEVLGVQLASHNQYAKEVGTNELNVDNQKEPRPDSI